MLIFPLLLDFSIHLSPGLHYRRAGSRRAGIRELTVLTTVFSDDAMISFSHTLAQGVGHADACNLPKIKFFLFACFLLQLVFL